MRDEWPQLMAEACLVTENMSVPHISLTEERRKKRFTVRFLLKLMFTIREIKQLRDS
jgi:hypothetical protein